MRRLVKLLLLVAVVAAAGGLLWRSAGRAYLDTRRERLAAIDSLGADLERYRLATGDHGRVQGAIRAFADRTLGGDLETVDHELRHRLNRIGESLSLGDLSVGTGRARTLQSPARSRFAREHAALRNEIDFVEVEGSISGTAPLEAALALVHRVQAEPWLKRIDHVRLQPKENGKLVTVSVRLVTVFLPGSGPAAVLPPAENPPGFEPYAQLAARNPFRMPAPDAPVPAAVARTGGRGLDRWMLTGIASGPSAVTEVWLLDRTSGASRRITVGEAFEDITLLSAAGEVAAFAIGGETVRIRVGSALSAPLPPEL